MKPEVSLAIREEIEESKLKAKTKYDNIEFDNKQKHEKFNQLSLSYKQLCIQQPNWWDEVKSKLIEQIQIVSK